MRNKLVAALMVVHLGILTQAGCSAAYRDPQARTVGQAADDLAIGAKVKARLLADDEISGLRINVDVWQRTVTLRGRVPSTQLQERAVGLARGIKGVRSVRSELRLPQ